MTSRRRPGAGAQQQQQQQQQRQQEQRQRRQDASSLPLLLSAAAALTAAACVTSRFPPFAARLPAFADDAVFVVAGAALGITVAAESRMKRGSVGPLWMRVAGWPRLALALLLSFCTTVIAQLLEVSLGPVDPSFPATAPFATNALWFFVFTLGFSGIGMMSAPGVFLPFLAPPARALRRLPLAASAAVLAVVGGAAGVAFGRVLVLPAVVDVVGRVQDWIDANAQLVLGVTLALTVGPALIPSREKDEDAGGGDDGDADDGSSSSDSDDDDK